MRHTHTTATAVTKLKRRATLIVRNTQCPRAEALEKAAVEAGYDSFHHVTTCATKTQREASQDQQAAPSLTFVQNTLGDWLFIPSQSVDPETDELDELLETLNVTEVEHLTAEEAERVITTCLQLIARNPGFIDGYAHYAWAKLGNGHAAEVWNFCSPRVTALLQMIPGKFQGNISYWVLENRPIHRLVHSTVLASMETQQHLDQAKRYCRRMLALWPNDNLGFRFLLTKLEGRKP